MLHKEDIIRKYHDGMPVKSIAKDEGVADVTIYTWLLKWGVVERREKVTSAGYTIRKKSTLILPFEKRVSSELLTKMKENTKVNEKYASRYILNENYYTIGRF